jgi:SAM-dependent methyltransferase
MAVEPEERENPGFRDPDRSDVTALIAGLDHFDKSPQIRRARRMARDLMRPLPGAHLLDAGCGTGVDVAAFAGRVGPDGIVVGLDLSEGLVSTARRRHLKVQNVRFAVGSILNIPFPSRSFDACLSMRTIQYLDDAPAALRELRRVTRPGGRVVICEGAVSSVDLPDKRLTDLILDHANPARNREFGGMSLPRFMRGAGFVRLVAQPAFGLDFGQVDPLVLDYMRASADTAVERGAVSKKEAASWLRGMETAAADGSWFSLDCILVVAGEVPL